MGSAIPLSLSQPGAEALVHFVDVIAPPFPGISQGALGIFRAVGHVGVHIHAFFGVRRYQCLCGDARGAVGDVAADASYGFRCCGEIEELLCGFEVPRSRDNDKPARVQYLPVPYDDEGLVFQYLCIEDAPVVGRGHNDLAIGEHLRWLCSGLPPYDVVFDGV